MQTRRLRVARHRDDLVQRDRVPTAGGGLTDQITTRADEALKKDQNHEFDKQPAAGKSYEPQGGVFPPPTR